MKKISEVLRTVLISPFLALIYFYRKFISPYKPPSCRFVPTCSSYALEAFRRHGPILGLFLTVWRISRCHPWGGHGYDPVPEKGFVRKFLSEKISKVAGSGKYGKQEDNNP